MNTSLKPKSRSKSRPPWHGAATPEFSVTMPKLAISDCASRASLQARTFGTTDELATRASRSREGPGLGNLPSTGPLFVQGPPHFPGRFFGVLRVSCHGAALVRSSELANRNRPAARRACRVCNVLGHADCDRLRHQPGIQHRLRLSRRIQCESRASDDSAARYPAIDSRIEFSAGRDARNGRPVSQPPVRNRIRVHSADFLRAGAEHGIQFLFLTQVHSPRDARGRRSLRMEQVAKTKGAGASVFGDRPGLELDDFGSKRLVLPDCLRNVHIEESRLSPSRPGFLPANGGKCSRYACDCLGFGRNGRGSDSDRPTRVAPDDCLGGKIQVRTSGKCARPTFTRSGSAEKFTPGLANGPHVHRSGARTSGSAFRPHVDAPARRRSSGPPGSLVFLRARDCCPCLRCVWSRENGWVCHHGKPLGLAHDSRGRRRHFPAGRTYADPCGAGDHSARGRDWIKGEAIGW